MTDHLPECGMNDVTPVVDYHLGVYCCCDRLRACEQRVRLHAALSWEQGFEEGRTAGLDAAREAVTRTCHHTKYDGCRPCSHDTAAAAIDALRQPPPLTAHYDPAAKDNRP